MRRVCLAAGPAAEHISMLRHLRALLMAHRPDFRSDRIDCTMNRKWIFVRRRFLVLMM